jgi:ketosteroid isomerase-like protein
MPELTSTDIERLRELVEEVWLKGGLERDWDASLAICTDDYVYMVPDQPALHGKDEARAFLAGFPPLVEATQKLESVIGSTELAACRFSAQLTIELEGKEVSGTAKGLALARKKDGEWLFTHGCFNFDAPLGEGA